MRYVWKLLRARVQIFWNGVRRARLRTKIGYIVLSLLVLGLMVVSLAGSFALARILQEPGFPPSMYNSLENGLPAAFVLVTFFLIGSTAFSTALQGLYLSNDLELLLSFPVPVRSVFVAKFVETILPGLLFAGWLLLPPMIGYGIALRYALGYLVAAPLVLVLTTLAASALSTLIVMALARFVPPRRLAEVLGFVGAIASLLCSQSWWLMGRAFRADSLEQALDGMAALNAPWSPIGWASNALAELGTGSLPVGLGYLVLFATFSIGLFGAALLSAEHLFYAGWARVRSGGGSRGPARARVAAPPALESRRAARGWAAQSWWLSTSAVRAIVVKDFRVLRRDLRHLSQLISPFILLVVYLFAFVYNPRRPGNLPGGTGAFFQSIASFSGVGLALFASLVIVSQLALMGFSQEGRYFWLLKSSPVRARDLVAGKFLVAYLPLVVLATVILVVVDVAQGVAWLDFVYGWLSVMVTSFGLTALDVALGAATARFQWETPAQMVRGWAGFLSTMVNGVYLLVTMGLFFAPLVGTRLLRQSSEMQMAIMAGGIMLGAAVVGLVSIVALRFAVGRVPRMDEVS